MTEATETDPGREDCVKRYVDVAPTWHGLVVLSSVVLFAGLSAYSGTRFRVPHSRLMTYVVTIVFQWSLVSFLLFGIRFRGLRLRDLIGGGWSQWPTPLNDLGIALAFQIGANLILARIVPVMLATPRTFMRSFAPHGKLEVAGYLLLSVTAGFCEELIFRGYLQKQFTAWTQSATSGLLLQAVVFGAGHGYQGLRWMAVIGVYGCLIGILALWRGSLRPGMIAHFLQDAITGLVWMR